MRWCTPQSLDRNDRRECHASGECKGECQNSEKSVHVISPRPRRCQNRLAGLCDNHHALEFFDQSGLATGKKKAHQIGARALRLAFQMRGGFYRCQAVRQKRNPGVPPRLSLRLSAVWGTIIGLVISDARASDCISIFREVTASTKRPKFTQQSRQRGCVAASGFASSPIRAVFLDSNRWAVERAVKRRLHLRPQLPL